MKNLTQRDIEQAAKRLTGVAKNTPLQYNDRLSTRYGANIYIKREDLQDVRSFKIRGAYNKISNLSVKDRKRGVVAASAGNHAQGVAYSCNKLQIKGVIFMPQTTPNQKIERVRHFGGSYVIVKLLGHSFDEAYNASQAYAKVHESIYIHPFNDLEVMAGQGTIAKEVYDKLGGKIDYVFSTIGGGGLVSGIGAYMKAVKPSVRVIGAEPAGAASMQASIRNGKPVTLSEIDTFVDGAAVKTAGNLTLRACKSYVDRILTVPEGRICTTIIELYQNEGIIAEPAGALAISALEDLEREIKGKTVVCVLSGGNNDLLRYSEIVERSLVYQGLKHYFIVEFAQKPGQLARFLKEVLGPNDDIVLFDYIKKNNREKGPALVGIELTNKDDFQGLIERFNISGIGYKIIKSDDLLYNYLI